MKPLLIFDYDGTIHNTMGIYEPAFRKAHEWLIGEGLRQPEEVTYERISAWLGINSVDMWNDFAPELPSEIQMKASGMVGDEMARRVNEGMASWYDGAADALTKLKELGYTMVILSNCKTQYRNAHWNHFGMDEWFSEFYDCESYGFIPKTEIVLDIMKKYPGEYVVIGDRASDMEGARACAGRFVGCMYGFGLDGELSAADAFAEDVRELPDVIERLVREDETTRLGNPRKPEGEAGAAMLDRMNKSHYEVTGWGLSFTPIADNDTVLDIGCGGGMTLKRIAEKTNGRVCGIDYSSESVAKSRQLNGDRVEVIEGSVEAMPYEDNSFDRIVTVESFYFWPDHKENLKEVRRVLKEGGTFQIIADVYDDGNLTEAAKVNMRRYNLYNPTKEQFGMLLEEAGFIDVKVHTKEGTTWICAEGKK